jgi:hypothetical protein
LNPPNSPLGTPLARLLLTAFSFKLSSSNGKLPCVSNLASRSTLTDGRKHHGSKWAGRPILPPSPTPSEIMVDSYKPR